MDEAIARKLRRASVAIPLIFVAACERTIEPDNAAVDRSSDAPTLAISIGRDDVAYMADHDIQPMIGTGPCNREKASVWYSADVVSGDGRIWPNPADALRNDPGRRFSLFATMQYPAPAVTDDCAYLTTVGYSLHGLAARSLPLRVKNRS